MTPSTPPACFDRDGFEAIPMAAFATGTRGRIVAWNSRAAELLGIPAGDACGKPCAALLDGRTLGGAAVCSPSCMLVRQVSEWMGDASPGGRRDWRPEPTPLPASHPDMVVRRGDSSRLSVGVLGFPALLDDMPVLVHLLSTGDRGGSSEPEDG
jgi:PAS domain-containing protein